MRLPGSGGACEISILAKKVFVIAPQTKRSFPEKVDFITSPGYVDGGRDTRRNLGMPGPGPVMVITNLGCYEFQDGEMILTSLHPNCTLQQVRETLGWEVRVANQINTTDPPHAEELRIIREELDPNHLYI